MRLQKKERGKCQGKEKRDVRNKEHREMNCKERNTRINNKYKDIKCGKVIINTKWIEKVNRKVKRDRK